MSVCKQASKQASKRYKQTHQHHDLVKLKINESFQPNMPFPSPATEAAAVDGEGSTESQPAPSHGEAEAELVLAGRILLRAEKNVIEARLQGHMYSVKRSGKCNRLSSMN